MEVEEENFEEKLIMDVQNDTETWVLKVGAKHYLVACVNLKVGDWTVYYGKSDEGWKHVKEWGTKVSREMGEFFFPQYKKYRWRE